MNFKKMIQYSFILLISVALSCETDNGACVKCNNEKCIYAVVGTIITGMKKIISVCYSPHHLHIHLIYLIQCLNDDRDERNDRDESNASCT